MKSLLLLPMVALLCFGCSKESIQGNDDLGLATQNSSSDLIELVYSGPGNETPYNPLDQAWIEYTDADGQLRHVQFPDFPSSFRVQIPRNSIVKIRPAASITNPKPGYKIKWAVWTYTPDTPIAEGVNESPFVGAELTMTASAEEQFNLFFAAEIVPD